MRITASIIGILVLVTAGIFLGLNRPPAGFPAGSSFIIKKGDSLRTVSVQLEEMNVVRSATLLRMIVIAFGHEGRVVEGEYLLGEPSSAFLVAERIMQGRYGYAAVKVTIPEGLASFDIADILAAKLTDFDKKGFLKLAKEKEGYLFPDTYFFMPKAKPAEVVEIMTDNFDKKVSSSTREAVIMASIIEEEARTSADRRAVADVLYHRLAIGMPLQVDVTFSYIYGTTTPVIYYKDLEVDSPYNTYKHSGLPPGPISNPGLDAIVAAKNPSPTKYLYYLSDKNGVMHYAVTHDEHVRNKLKYLK